MSRSDGDLLILGIGNVLLGDEGVGVHVVRALEADAAHAVSGKPLPPQSRVVDGGTLGLDLLPLINDARAIVFVDAVALGAPAGSMVTLESDRLRAVFAGHLSVHQVGIGDLLAVAILAGMLPEHVALVGVQPESAEFSLELSPAVQAVVPAASRAARAAAWMLHARASSAQPADAS